jgi:sporulation protein YlmC with PRC-barrel domain
MNRLLTCTALGLVLGLSPALAQDPNPADETQMPPAVQEPAQPEAVPSDPAQPSDPAAPIPGDTSEMSPSQPDAALPQSSEAPKTIEPAAPKSAEADSGGAQFLTQQESSDYLASNLIGESVYNSQDEVIGSINDLVTDNSGKIVAVLLGHGGFLGMGEKDVAIRFEDLKIAREDNNDIKVVANMSSDTLAAAPDYEKLSEQNVTVGADTDRDDAADRGASQSY